MPLCKKHTEPGFNLQLLNSAQLGRFHPEAYAPCRHECLKMCSKSFSLGQ